MEWILGNTIHQEKAAMVIFLDPSRSKDNSIIALLPPLKSNAVDLFPRVDFGSTRLWSTNWMTSQFGSVWFEWVTHKHRWFG